jgi:hypothetical protein
LNSPRSPRPFDRTPHETPCRATTWRSLAALHRRSLFTDNESGVMGMMVDRHSPAIALVYICQTLAGTRENAPKVGARNAVIK